MTPVAFAAAVLLLLEATLLAMSLLRASSLEAYLSSLLGLGTASLPGPAAFTTWDVGCCVLLAAGLTGAARARPWARAVLTGAAGVLLYPTLTGLAVQFSPGALPGGFTAGHHLYVNAVLVAETLVCTAALLTSAIAARTRRP
ncbi:hypothetical protein ACL02U_30385 [Streptomyces sp. MS06]|uniref:hypothetical protein n=1 Tax=Streptomyces sp. MS06 TaxID=3385974 RepID=UPI0039A3B32B